MANEKGKGTGKRRKPLRYFFLNDKLHKKLHINRAADIIMAWSYPDGKRVGYTYSDVLRRYEKAYTTQEVCSLVNRHRNTVEWAIIRGDISRPQTTYDILTKNQYRYMWNEKNIMELHDYLLTVHRGRPRKDGEITVQAMPSKRELRAIMRGSETMYVKDDNGEFVPTWRAEEF